ncbi:MAG: NAD-dependent epimerase/dehydratase family protein [Planctomycetes bacterium]|nr:NAD-dependent epimerase/dehydratase family protein [Planctomycetota bacterium]
MKSVRLIVGCGYVGSRVASHWLAKGDRVLAITRTEERGAELGKAGIEPVVWNWLSRDLPKALPPVPIATILVAVSHSPPPGQLPEMAHVAGLGNLWRWLDSQGGGVFPSGYPAAMPRWIYLSTTGVFAASGRVTKEAEWVDESSAVGPVRPGSIAALGGEDWINKSNGSKNCVVLRPAGIYGPDRVPRWQAIRDQKPMEVDPESYLNLIHVDDLVTSIAVVAEHPAPSALYCVSDGNSPTRREYYEWISQVMGLPSPIFTQVGEDPNGQSQSGGSPNVSASGGATTRIEHGALRHDRPVSRSDSNKRVSNQKLLEELNIQLRYPTFRHGLHSLVGHPQ